MTERKTQLVDLSAEPSEEYLKELGRIANRFGQLEHMLKLVIKRKDKRSFWDVFDKKSFGKASIGSLLSGVSEYGNKLRFEGLIKAAEEEEILQSLVPELENAKKLVSMRNKYLHGGLGKRGHDFYWLEGELFNEIGSIRKLKEISTAVYGLINSINTKIPPEK